MTATKTKQVTRMTDAQYYVLGYMDQLNLGVLFSDVLQKWIWRADVRQDKNLATGLIAEKNEIADYVRRILEVR